MGKVRADLLIVDNHEILLMHRIKNGDEYFVLPGGSVEPGESLVEGATREAKEETGLDVKIDKELWRYHNDADGRDHVCFLVSKYSGILKLGHPEVDRMTENNKYFLEWHELKELKDIRIYPEDTKIKILETFKND